MVLQIVVGSGLMLVSILMSGLSFWLMEWLFARARRWLSRAPHRPKLTLALGVASVWILALITTGVWIWALPFYTLGIFPTLEESAYFSLVAFTTLGFGDVLLPRDWRLLAGMAAANGLLNFGFLTAILVEALRQVRVRQMEWLSGGNG